MDVECYTYGEWRKKNNHKGIKCLLLRSRNGLLSAAPLQGSARKKVAPHHLHTAKELSDCKAFGVQGHQAPQTATLLYPSLSLPWKCGETSSVMNFPLPTLFTP